MLSTEERLSTALSVRYKWWKDIHMTMPTEIQAHTPLLPYTTLGIGGSAEYFVQVENIESLRRVCTWAHSTQKKITVLGGGSNVLVHDKGIKDLVVQIGVKGRHYAQRDSVVFVTAGAGEHFDSLVSELVERNIWGLENLSAIPGLVGAVPIQNVGAYGAEASEYIVSVVAYDTHDDVFVVFDNEKCNFSYRDSFFKSDKGKRFIVVWVTFALSYTQKPRISYKDLAVHFINAGSPSLKEIRNAVIEIRSRKFPDWNEIGTAGSFFKNPIVPKTKFEELRLMYPEIPGYEVRDGAVKVPLGFILDKILGLKGHREGNVGLYENQALVLVNYGNASAREVDVFVRKIISNVKERVDITVEWEVTKLF